MSPSDHLDVAWLIAGAESAATPHRRITLTDGRVGSIVAVEDAGAAGRLVLPALVNAHDHAPVVRNS